MKFVGKQHSPPHTLVISDFLSTFLPAALLLSPSSVYFSFSTSLWIIELFLSRGPVSLIRFVGHQVCFTAPSPEAARATMLPHDIEEITHKSLTYISMTLLLVPSQSFFFSSEPALLTLTSKFPLLPLQSLFLSFCNVLLSISFHLPSLCLLSPSLCFSVMSRPTAGCHRIDGGKKMESVVREGPGKSAEMSWYRQAGNDRHTLCLQVCFM